MQRMTENQPTVATSAAEARAMGLDRYTMSVPCRYGHLSERRTVKSSCIECERERSKSRPSDYHKKDRCKTCGAKVRAGLLNQVCRTCFNKSKRLKIVLTCEWCESQFSPLRPELRWAKHTYCSKECRLEGNRESRRQRFSRVCRQCGKTFVRYPSQALASDMCCSYECKAAFMKVALAGENGPSYIDGRTPLIKRIRRSATYDEWRVAVLAKASYRCTSCHLHKPLHAHHVRPFAEIAGEFLESTDGSWLAALSYEPFWDMDNGIALCRDCHSVEHPDLYLIGGMIDAR